MRHHPVRRRKRGCRRRGGACSLQPVTTAIPARCLPKAHRALAISLRSRICGTACRRYDHRQLRCLDDQRMIRLGSKEDQPDFESRQGSQRRIAKPILPAMDRPSSVVDDDGLDQRPMRGHRLLRFTSSEDLGDDPEGVVGILVVASMLPFRQLDFLARQLLVRNLAQDVSERVQSGATLRARPEINESTFERVKHGFTTQSSYHILWW